MASASCLGHVVLVAALLAARQCSASPMKPATVHRDATTGEPLPIHEYLSHFEVLPAAHVQTRRRRRGLDPMESLVSFSTHDEHLELVLKPDVALFAKGLRVVSVGEDGVEREFTYPRHQHVVGHVRGRRSSSYARLHIDDETGLMQGSVALERGETYFLERAGPHLGDGKADHMLVYAASAFRMPQDRTFPGNVSRGSGPSFCGHTHSENARGRDAAGNKAAAATHWDPDATARAVQEHARFRRAAASRTDNTCSLRVVIDSRKFAKEGNNQAAAIATAVAYISKADERFRATEFSAELVGMGVTIGEVIIYESSASDPYYSASEREAKVILDDFSTTDHSSFCLAHLFTHYDVPEGVLGLAYVGTTATNQGGVCSLRTSVSLNTGFTSSINHGVTQPFLLVSLVLTHELGHNWGAEHDTGGACVDQPGGQYIMYPNAVDGSASNNDKFSSCSIGFIRTVLEAPASACFGPTPDGVCGNGIIEPDGADGEAGTPDDEECDAGFTGSACCDTSCKLIAPAVCEDLNAECCASCAFDGDKVCFQEFDFDADCHATTLCRDGGDNVTFSCPTLKQKPPGTICINGGRCQPNPDRAERCRPFCEQFSATDCQCTPESLGGLDECAICCENDPDGTPYCPPGTTYLTLTHSDGVTGDLTTCFGANDGTNYDGATQQETPLTPFSSYTTCIAAYKALDDTLYDLVVDPTTPTSTSKLNLGRTNGAICESGTCANSECVVAPSDFLNKLFNFFGQLSLALIAKILKENLVASTLIISLILWIPATCCLWRHDRKQRAQQAKPRVSRSSTFKRGQRSGGGDAGKSGAGTTAGANDHVARRKGMVKKASKRAKEGEPAKKLNARSIR